jgi:hypothetical protein
MRVEETTTVIMDVEEDGGKGVADGGRAGNGRHTELHHNRSIDKLSQNFNAQYFDL